MLDMASLAPLVVGHSQRLWSGGPVSQEDLDPPVHRGDRSDQQLEEVATQGHAPARGLSQPPRPVLHRPTTRFDGPGGGLGHGARDGRRWATVCCRREILPGTVQKRLESAVREKRRARREDRRVSRFGRGVEAEVTLGQSGQVGRLLTRRERSPLDVHQPDHPAPVPELHRLGERMSPGVGRPSCRARGSSSAGRAGAASGPGRNGRCSAHGLQIPGPFGETVDQPGDVLLGDGLVLDLLRVPLPFGRRGLPGLRRWAPSSHGSASSDADCTIRISAVGTRRPGATTGVRTYRTLRRTCIDSGDELAARKLDLGTCQQKGRPSGDALGGRRLRRISSGAGSPAWSCRTSRPGSCRRIPGEACRRH